MNPLPTTVDGLLRVLAGFATREGMLAGLSFRPRSTDVFIATFAKSGTTLLQQIVHGLRTGGDMDFEDISEVVPWIEMAVDTGIDATASQRAEPRAFKTHLDWSALPKGGRAIWVVRDPESVIVSHYHFFSGWFFEPGSIGFEEFALDFVLSRDGRHQYWDHLISWWAHKDDPEVLPLCYETVVEDLAVAVRQVSDFLDLACDEQRIELATRQAELDFMKGYPTLWEDVLLRRHRNSAMNLPEGAGSTKVREGKTLGPRAEMTPAVREAWTSRWNEIVTPATGCEDYPALRRAMKSSTES